MERSVPSLESMNRMPSSGKGGPESGPIGLPENPFVGLRPFNSDEGLLFFGRREQTMHLLQQLHLTRFLAIVGSSGCGKSSLIRAGLIPKLQAGFLVEQRDQWRMAMTKPGDAPLHNLALSLLKTVSDGPNATASAPALVEAMRVSGAQAIIEFLTPLLKDLDANLMVLVDQFEELFSFGQYAEKETPDSDDGGDKEKQVAERLERERRRDEATDFVSTMLGLARQSSLPIYVVMTMRSDFLGDCDAFYGLPETMNRSQYLVPRLTRQQRQEAIENPIVLYGQAIAPRLLDRVLNDSGEEADQLPVMQHTMMRTWEKWRATGDPTLDLEHYEAAGTTKKALSDDAEEALAGMSDDDLKVTERLFQALTDTDARGRRTRRPAHLRDIESITGAPREKLFEIITHFRSDGRSFLTLSQDEADPLIDISHESLIRQWTRLRDWVALEARSKDLYLRLVGTAIRYYKPEPEDELIRGPALQLALEWREKRKPNQAWADRYHPDLAQALTFLEESKARRDKDAAEAERSRNERAQREREDLERAQLLAEQKQRLAEAEAAARKTELEQAILLANQKEAAARWQRRAIYALGFLLILAVATTVYAVRAGIVAEQRKTEAEKRKSEAVTAQENAEKLSNRLALSLRTEKDLKDQLSKNLERETTLKNVAEKARVEAVKLRDQAVSLAQRANQQARIAAASAAREKAAVARVIEAKALAEAAADESAKSEETARKERTKALATQLANQTFREGLAFLKTNNPASAAKKYEEAALGYKSLTEPDREGEAICYLELADIDLKSEDSKALNKGANRLEEAANIYKDISNTNGTATVLIRMGDFITSSRVFEDATAEEADEIRTGAAEFYRDAFDSYEKSRNLQGMVFAAAKLRNLHRISKNPEDLRTLISVYKRLLPFYAEKEFSQERASVYIMIGKTHAQLKETDKATENLENALKVYRDARDSEAEAKTYVDIGFELGGADEIKANIEHGLRTVRAMQDPLAEANTLRHIASKLSDRRSKGPTSRPGFDSESAEAANYYKQALTLYQNIGTGTRIQQAETLSDLGTISLSIDKSVALDNFQKALALYTDDKEGPQRAPLLFSIGSLQEEKGRLDEALKSYEDARDIFRREDLMLEDRRAKVAIQRVEALKAKTPTTP